MLPARRGVIGGLIRSFCRQCHINENSQQDAQNDAVFWSFCPVLGRSDSHVGGNVMRLWAEDLACVRGERKVFTGIRFSLGGGEALTVTGANGSGKSSLLRTIAGLVRLTAGRMSLEDGNPERSLAEQAHYLGHQDAFKTSLTVLENLQFWHRYLGGGGEAVDAALGAVGLDGLSDLPASYLSAGQQRRLSIARLIAVKRPIWLLDEPATALDGIGQTRLAALMREHLADGGLIVASTHGPIGLAATHEIHLGVAA